MHKYQVSGSFGTSAFATTRANAFRFFKFSRKARASFSRRFSATFALLS